MKARQAAVVVAIVLAIVGGFHQGRRHASRSALPEPPPSQIGPASVEPGGWWDWH